MRVRSRRGLLLVATIFSALVFPVASQDNEGFPILDDVKLIAEKAALPTLEGKDKFILREQWFSGKIDPGEAKLLQVQLFRRNSYQFWLAVPNKEAGLNLNLYNSDGEMVETETITFDSTNVVSTIVETEATGLYYLRISMKMSIDQPQDWALIYGYR